MSQTTMYVGSFIWRDGKGIYTFSVDTDTGAIAPLGLIPQDNPSYIVVNPEGTCLYCVLETGEFKGQHGGGVASYEILPKGELKLLNEMPTQGGAPTHLSLSPGNTHLFAANYSEGTAVCYPLLPDGSIGKDYTILPHHGKGPNPTRQQKPFAHFALLSPDSLWLCVVDLGIDAIMLHPYTKEHGAVLEGSIKVPVSTPGAGPRHMIFSKDGKHAYVVCELISQIEVYQYLGTAGMKHVQTVSTLPEGYEGVSYCAAIRISGDGKNIYVSNRGHESVAAFSIQPDGLLRANGICPTGGKNPRDINLLPGGNFLLCGHQDQGGITVLKVKSDGTLASTDISYDTPCPVCFAFGK